MKFILMFALLFATSAAWGQTNTSMIGGLPQATTPLTGAELIPLQQGGVTKQATVSQIVSQGAPATSSSVCTAGQIAYGSSFFYVCVSANHWMRAALSSF